MGIFLKNLTAQRGVFLIEVLVTAVVVAIGLLSLASLQGRLMSSSGESKARTEAVMLAEARLEEFRNNIIKGNYEAVVSSTANESINGTNATFSRSWCVDTDCCVDPDDCPTDPGRKNIRVKVTWYTCDEEDEECEKIDKTVNMVTELAWSDPGIATEYATSNNGLIGGIQSPNNNSSEVVDKQFDLNDIPSAKQLSDGSNLIQYEDDEGYIYLLKKLSDSDPDSDPNKAEVLIKFKGGVIHTIKGHVYTGVFSKQQSPPLSISPLIDYPVTFSDLAYCVFPVTSGQSDYICYFGGDCSADKNGSGCSTSTTVPTDAAVFGGWYGKVGLLETDDYSFHNKKVCFAEDIASDVALTATTTARLYSTQRLNADNVVTRLEGINQSFACQDFLVVNATGNSNDCHYFQDFSGVSVPSSSVQRSLGVDEESDVPLPNVSLAENVSSCGATVTYTIVGGIAGVQANLVSVSVNGNSCTITTESGAYSYSCTITTVNTTTSLTIAATGGNVAPASTSITVSTSQTSITGPTLTTSTPVTITYHITGVISGNSASQVSLSLADGTCTKALNGVVYNYECTITTTPKTVTIVPTGGSVALETGSVAEVSLVDVTNVVGPNFVATTATSMVYTITGTITGSQANAVTFSMSNGGICTNNNNGTYSCTITLVPDTVTISASGGNVSPTSDTAILAGVTPVTGPSFHADNLASCVVTVTGNFNKGTGGGAKDPGDKNVTVSYSKSSPSGTGNCTKNNASDIYTYSCEVGSVNNSASVTMSGAKITVGTPNPVPVTCAATPLILTGPNLTTTN